MSLYPCNSLQDLFLKRVSATPDATAYLYPEDGDWKPLTWRQTGDRVRDLANGLLALGLAPGECVAIASNTRVEWILADLAVLCAGGVTATVYASSTEEDTGFILADSKAVVAFAEDAVQAQKILKRRNAMPGLRRIVVIDASGGLPGDALSLPDLAALGRTWEEAHPKALAAAAAVARPLDLATIIYTSGTTGRPKGVELSHDCWLFVAESVETTGVIGPLDHQFFWLPLAHVFGKAVIAVCIGIGISTAIDGRVDRIAENLAVVKPTFVGAVPRIFEKIHGRVLGQVLAAGGLKSAIFRWAVGVGTRVSSERQQGHRPGPWLRLQHALADRLVFHKVRDKFGGRLRFFFSGSAPLARELGEFFDAFDVTILEGYGLTESTAVSFFNRLGENRYGTVGTPIPGTDVKIAADGEILLRGRGIMRGYHGLPHDTAEALDADGWLHTGDIGVLGEAGRLSITDRKKDLIKTSGGKYVAPQHVEGMLKLETPLISHALLVGNNRRFCAALICLSEEEILAWARTEGLEGRPYDELVRDPRVETLVRPHVENVNAGLARHETIKRWAILPAELKIESGELTPSLKVRRKVVEQHYHALLEELFAEKQEGSAA